MMRFREVAFFGVAATLSFPPFNIFILGFVAWLPVFKWLDEYDQRKMSGRQLAGLSFLSFLFWNMASTYWVANTSFIPGLVAFLMNSFFMMIVVWGTGMIRRRSHPLWRIWILPVAWISFEYLHHQWELTWPWLTLGNSLADQIALIQWYSWTGVFGGTLWIFLMNILVYRYLKGKPPQKKALGQLSLAFAVPMLISLFMYIQTEDQGTPVDVAVIQPNFEPHYEKFRLPANLQIDRFIDLSRSIVDSNTQFLVFPETSFSIRDVSRIERFRPVIRLREMLNDYPGMTLVTGFDGFRFHTAEDKDKREVRSYAANGGDTIYYSVLNAAMSLNSGPMDSIPIYLKSKLVPGPEIFPYGKVLFFLQPVIEMLDGTLSHFALQPERTTLGTQEHPVAPVICYESVFGDYNSGYIDAGAQAIFIMTNDGWWDNTPGHQQHLAYARMRAIEQRKSIARSANTGISCFIDQKGRISQATKYGVEAAIRQKILFNNVKTVYQKSGDIIAKVALLMLIFLFAGAFIARKD